MLLSRLCIFFPQVSVAIVKEQSTYKLIKTFCSIHLGLPFVKKIKKNKKIFASIAFGRQIIFFLDDNTIIQKFFLCVMEWMPCSKTMFSHTLVSLNYPNPSLCGCFEKTHRRLFEFSVLKVHALYLFIFYSSSCKPWLTIKKKKFLGF